MKNVFVIALAVVAVLVTIEAAVVTRYPEGCQKSTNPSYRYCCASRKSSKPVKTNLHTAGSARTDEQIQAAHREVQQELEQRVGNLEEGCYPKPSGGYCCE